MPRLIIDLANVQQLLKTHSQIIPAEYLDVMGHMNVMWYTHLFSMGLVGLMKLVGVTETFDDQHDSGTFALESHIRYLSEVRVGQTIHIHTRMIGRSEKRFHILHFMTNDDKQDVSATFEIVGSCVNLSQRRTAPIPPNMAGPIDRLVTEGNALMWEAPICGTMSA
jgi:acyl-CoA thioester hydrolase